MTKTTFSLFSLPAFVLIAAIVLAAQVTAFCVEVEITAGEEAATVTVTTETATPTEQIESVTEPAAEPAEAAPVPAVEEPEPEKPAEIAEPQPEEAERIDPAVPTFEEILGSKESTSTAYATGTATSALGMEAFTFESEEFEGPREINIQSNFIKIVTNTMPVDTGRFLSRTVKGDPSRDTDDEKILIYGGALPWTSFTTFRIDGQNYVFGGPTHRRAGRDALYGEVIEPPRIIGTNTIVTKCMMKGIEITQTLSIVGGPISKLDDTVKINYTIRNKDAVAHRIGVRVVIDTLLGSNDASPFKVGEESITTETELVGIDILDYWIAFDSLEDPGVVARGTLRGPGLTTPDRVVFANWGKLADNIWDIPYAPGSEFKRAEEEAMDSATALYWDEATISPMGEIQYSTLYGIDYLNVSGDVLSIGATRHLGEWSTAKNQIRPYTLYAYVANTSAIDLHEVLITIDTPDGIEMAGKDIGVRRLGTLRPGDEKTVGWAVQPRVAAGGEKTMTITGSSFEVEPVEIKTGVMLLSPPGIIPTVIAPEVISRSQSRDYGPYGPPVQVQLKCKNDGRSPIDNLTVDLVLPDGLEFPRIQKSSQSYRRLDGLQEVVFSWKVSASGTKTGSMPLKFNITSDSTEDKSLEHSIEVDPLPVAISWLGIPEETFSEVFFSAELFVTDIPDIGSAEFSVRYNADVVEVVRVSQGTLFVENGQPLPWKEPKIDNKLGMVSGIKGRRASPLEDAYEGSLLVIHFRTVAPGMSPIEVMNLVMTDRELNVIDYVIEPGKIKVTE